MCGFAEKLRSGAFPVALEITPPRRVRPAILLRRATRIGGLAAAVNVIQRPDRWPSVQASCSLLGRGLEPAWHLVTRGRRRAEVEAEIQDAAAAGLRIALCVRGDHEARDANDTPRLRDAVRRILDRSPGTLVGVTFNQYAPRARALGNLFGKLDAGARFVQTQPVFEAPDLAPAAAQIRHRAPVSIVPMLVPVRSAEAAERLSRRLRIPVPARMRRRLRAGGEEAGWALFAETLAELRRCGWAAGVALVTPSIDAPERFFARLRAILYAELLGASPSVPARQRVTSRT